MKKIIFLLSVIIFSACSHKEQVDLIVHNAIVYTVDSTFSNAQSFAIKDGKFLAVGNNEEILNKYESKEIIDAEGKAVYPGLIDSHCHFYRYGRGLQDVDLVDTKSFDEIIKRVVEYSKTNKREWIIGKGWDQNDWGGSKEFPDNKKLDSLFPHTPVFLKRVDGHAVLVNSEAIRRAHVTIKNSVSGGVVEIKNNQLTGIFIDNAVELISKAIPETTKEEMKASLLAAQKNCFAVGLTTVDDAGIEKDVVELIDQLQKSNELQMRVYAMLTDNKENLDYYLKKGPFKTEKLNVCSFKFYGDGALGSRGACMIQSYSDKPEQRGFLLSTPQYYDSVAKLMFEKGFQMNTHCIGDSSVRLIQNIYSSYLYDPKKNVSAEIAEKGKNRRWRIEHYQVTTQQDIEHLAQLSKGSLIPSVQPTHATSDMYWAKDRLGAERVKYAYAFNDLLKAAGMLALGTDFPVENINPFYTFYSAVGRKDLKGFPEGGFQMENALSRENTLRGMTIWGAYANFEEKEKGSIEKGKFADFVILDTDIMKADINKVPATKVVRTFVNGQCVYQ